MWDPEGMPREVRGAAAASPDDGTSYVVMFDYGSIVFLGFTQEQQEVGWCVGVARAYGVVGVEKQLHG